MENLNKYIVISILSIGMIFPIFFGVYSEFFIVKDFNWKIFIILITGFFIFILFDKLIEIFVFNSNKVEIMKKHDVIHSLINKNNKIVIWVFFPLTMIMEELIFRYYLIGFLFSSLLMNFSISIIISSLFFSLYHIHTWFSYKNFTILSINLIYTFFLGLYLGFIFLHLGIILCIFVHYFVTIFMYYNIYRRYFRKR